MRVSKNNARTLEAAGFTYEYPGFWFRENRQVNITISDGPNRDTKQWCVDVISSDNSTYIYGQDFYSLENAIEYAVKAT